MHFHASFTRPPRFLWVSMREGGFVYSIQLARIKQGCIQFISTVGYREVTTSRFPITFLNTPYKIVAKALVLQFKEILPKIIQLEKINFSGCRYIHNIFIAIWDGIEWDHAFSIDALFIKIDFQCHMTMLGGP